MLRTQNQLNVVIINAENTPTGSKWRNSKYATSTEFIKGDNEEPK